MACGAAIPRLKTVISFHLNLSGYMLRQISLEVVGGVEMDGQKHERPLCHP